MFCVMPCGDFISSMLLHLVRTLVNITGPGDPPPSFVIPTRTVPDNFEVKDKKRKMYPQALWNACTEPQKQHFIRGTIQRGDQQYMGEIQMRGIVLAKSQGDLSCSWPLPLFLFRSWVTLMWTRWLKNKEARFSLIPAENRFAGRVWVGWGDSGGGEGLGWGEFCFIGERQQENHISVSVSICQGRTGAEGRGGTEEEGEEEIQRRIKWAGCEKKELQLIAL